MRTSAEPPERVRRSDEHAGLPAPGPLAGPELPASSTFDCAVPVTGLIRPDRSAGSLSRTITAAKGASGPGDRPLARLAGLAAPTSAPRGPERSVEPVATSDARPSDRIGHSLSGVVRRKIGFEYELDSIRTRHTDSAWLNPMKQWVQHDMGDRLQTRTGYDITADIGEGYSRVEFVTDAFDEHTELPTLLAVIESIRDDINAMRAASLTHEKKGYGAGTSLGGPTGWFASDRWIGLNEIPRLNGNWWQQVQYAARAGAYLVGQLQMTAGFTIEGLHRLVSGEQLGNVREWPVGWKTDVRQFVTSYARTDVPSDLYEHSLAVVRKVGLALDETTAHDRGRLQRAENGIAAVLSVMTQAPIAYRNAGTQAGLMIAKTDYAKILALVSEQTGVVLQADKLLTAVLAVVNRFVDGRDRAAMASPVYPQPDLDNVNFGAWIAGLLPQDARQPRRDLMTPANYPGTPVQKAGMRAYGPYGDRADPGGKAIFELRQLMKNPVTDLLPLAENLAAVMSAINMRDTS